MATITVQRGLCRIDDDERKFYGYMVRIMRRRQMHQEFFSDKRYGGKRKAKRLAKQRYDKLVAELPEKIDQKGQKTARNKSGKVGVHLAYDVDRRWPGCEYWSYVASWLARDGRRINVKFAWNKYGEETAWDLACISRDYELRDRKLILKRWEKKTTQTRRQSKKGPQPR